jgi:crossover junction endodeoxyribonuclease RusA
VSEGQRSPYGLSDTWPGPLPHYVLPIPYTSPPLSANDRMHRMQKARVTRKLRGDMKLIARAKRLPRMTRASATLHYVPGTNRRRDAENLAPTQKAVIDGALVSSGCLPDDSGEFLTLTAPVIHPKDPQGGRLWLEVVDLSSATAPGAASLPDPDSGALNPIHYPEGR